MIARAVILVLLCTTIFSPAFGIGCPQLPDPPFGESAETAHFVVVATLVRRAGDGKPYLNIETVLKDHEWLRGKKTIEILGTQASNANNNSRYLVFFEIDNGQASPFRGILAPAESKLPDYVKGAIQVRGKDLATRLLYFFNYLDSPETVIATDAFTEFANTDYKDARAIYQKFPAATLVKWLRDPNTPASHISLYGTILGHCGDVRKHAGLFRMMLKDPTKRASTSLPGILIGYLILDPKAGQEYVRELLSDEKLEFSMCYSALRALRFCWGCRRDLIPEEEIISNMELLLDQSDIADLAIDDLRRWGRWELTNSILPLYNKKSHNNRIIKRSIIKFALSVPAENKDAAAFLKQRRAEDPERVSDIEEMLSLEAPPSPKLKTKP